MLCPSRQPCANCNHCSVNVFGTLLEGPLRVACGRAASMDFGMLLLKRLRQVCIFKQRLDLPASFQHKSLDNARLLISRPKCQVACLLHCGKVWLSRMCLARRNASSSSLASGGFGFLALSPNTQVQAFAVSSQGLCVGLMLSNCPHNGFLTDSSID